MTNSFFSYLFLAFFGAVGVLARYFFTLIFPRVAQMNFPIILVNVLGSFLIGFLFRRFSQGGNASIFLWGSVGFCGGLTTFSSLILDVVILLQQQRLGWALLYLGLSVFFGVLALDLGMNAAKFF